MKAYIIFTVATLALLALLGFVGISLTSHSLHAVSGETIVNYKPVITCVVAFVILQVIYVLNVISLKRDAKNEY